MKEFEEAMEFIAGSCMVSPEMALQAILKRDPTEAEAEYFKQYLSDNECYECQYCGWFTHPGETCDCEEECEECGNIIGECSCE